MTVPSEKGVLLTYTDMATRWPEAVPLCKTTTRVVIYQLKAIFCRNGFPTSLVSDNGTQFTSKLFTMFLKANGIRTSCVAPQTDLLALVHFSLNTAGSRSRPYSSLVGTDQPRRGGSGTVHLRE